MTKMECSNIVGKEISLMTRCMGSLSQLSEGELRALIKEATKEIDHREDIQRKADINNAIVAIQKLSKHYHSLEVEAFIEAEGDNSILDIELIDIENALKNLL